MAENPPASRSLRWQRRVRYVVAVAFVLAASLHFTATETEMRLIPQWLPWHRALVYVSGVAEGIGAVGLLVPRTRRVAAWGLAALLLAVLPANINHTVTRIPVGGFMDTRLYHLIRLPLQPLFIVVVLWCATPMRGRIMCARVCVRPTPHSPAHCHPPRGVPTDNSPLTYYVK